MLRVTIISGLDILVPNAMPFEQLLSHTEVAFCAGETHWVPASKPVEARFTGVDSDNLVPAALAIFPDGPLSRADVYAELRSRGLYLATLNELLVFGMEYPSILQGGVSCYTRRRWYREFRGQDAASGCLFKVLYTETLQDTSVPAPGRRVLAVRDRTCY